jgi:DNA-binding GntR family transcriptional regulator
VTDILANLEPVASHTRREEVVMALRRAILNGEWQAGDRLREVALADRLGVSRPTVREAMRQLIQEGLLIQEPYRGTRVANPQPNILLEIADVRGALETLAARRAAEHGEATLRRSLEAALAELDRAAQSGDHMLMHEAHMHFHGLIFQASRSELLAQIWNLIQSRTAFALIWEQTSHPEARERLAPRHRVMAEAVLAGDPKIIDFVVEDHIRAAAKELVERRQSQER